MPLTPGDRIGSYEIIALLGAGGMGHVYRAIDSKLGREVAIKVLLDAFAQHPERMARFAREARLLASLSHPNIAVIYGLERENDLYYLEMELVRGETLAERFGRGPLAIADVLAIARQIADALEVAHDQNVVHRDLKPANVMVTPQRVVKILDFGLAKVTSGADSSPSTQLSTIASSPTMVGVVLGTAAYMSPEQARGDTVDRRTDIWAFGCLLYEAITGSRPFLGRTSSDAMAAVLREEPDWSKLTGLAPPRIQRLVRRCLQKDPHLRLHHIADARIEIDEVEREPIGGAMDSVSDVAVAPPRHATRGNRPQLAASAAAAALLTLASMAAIAWWRTNIPPALSPVARAMIALPPEQVLERGRFSPIALSPDGTLLVYVAAVQGGQTRLYLRRLDELDARPIPATEGANTPFFSPDARWLGFYAGGALKKISLAGGVPLTISETPPVWSASWQGDRIVFATTLVSRGLWTVPADGGDPVQLTTPKDGETQHGHPQGLPGGTHLLFSVLSDNAWHPAVLSLASGEWRVLGQGRIVGEGARYLPTGYLVYAQAAGLVATRFDPPDGDLNGPPVPLLERLDTTPFGGAHFAVAPDVGTLLYLPAGAKPADRALLRVDRDGRTQPLVDARLGYVDPALSPDGHRVAVTIGSAAGTDIWMIDLERGTRSRFTSGNTSASPVWAPDGSRLAFQSTAPGPSNLYWKLVDSNADAQPFFTAPAQAASSWPHLVAGLLPGTPPTLTGANPQVPVSWGRDRSALAFHERKPNGERDIWTVAPGRDPEPFLMTPFDERSPRFSPDERWLAYVSDESGRPEVYVQPFPGPGRKWLISVDGGTDPVWSRNGRELFYRQNDQMMVVVIAQAPELLAGRPRRLFETRSDAGDNGPNYDVSPDGTWFVMPRGDHAPRQGELHLVLNWFTEVAMRSTERR